MSHVGIIGGGVTGLASALSLSKRGFRVTVFESDATPMPSSPDDAFKWDRRGAPQVRHSHALLGRLHNLLRDFHPEVLKMLLDVGATEIELAQHMPDTLDDLSPHPDDRDLFMIAARRTTFEWVLRQTVMSNPDVVIRTGERIDGLVASQGDLPEVQGVVFDHGGSEFFDLVVAANGRRSQAPQWLRTIGVELPEEVEDTGIIYYSRFYRIDESQELPVSDRLVAGDLGYLKYGVFWGDNRTFSITLATSDKDKTFWGVRDPKVFDQVIGEIPAASEWLNLGAEPITKVHSMAGLLNRRRSLVGANGVIVKGFHMIGDALVCTNPLYGRGCATGFWQAHLLAEAIERNRDDSIVQAEVFNSEIGEHIIPWYQASVDSDRNNREIENGVLGEGSTRKSILQDGLMPATQTSAKVWRAFMRMVNLLAPPKILNEPEIMADVLEMWENRNERPIPPPLGPQRSEMMDLLGLKETA
ncbi:MAG: FAD-dependent oxidoreductase [Actinomycetota bacterium]|nr:FAD-dependent oxidoreductase [Actinomycetota bacterium]